MPFDELLILWLTNYAQINLKVFKTWRPFWYCRNKLLLGNIVISRMKLQINSEILHQTKE